jgi:hypothetical protein
MSGGPALSFQEVLITSQVDGTALTNTTTPTSILPAAARFTLPSNFFYVPGKMLRVTASGRISTVTTAPGNLTLDIRLGTVAAPIIVFTTPAMALNVTAQTNATWTAQYILTCRAIGSGTSANLLGTGSWTSRAVLGSAAVAAGGDGVNVSPDTAPAVGTGFDSTITNVVDFFATFSTANAANSIQCHQYILESLN